MSSDQGSGIREQKKKLNAQQRSGTGDQLTNKKAER